MLELLILLVVLVFTVPASIFFSVRRMAKSPAVTPVPGSNIMVGLPADVESFLSSQNFRFFGAFRFHSITLGVWTQPGSLPLHRVGLMRGPAGVVCEFITDFSDDNSLTTSRSRSAFMFPRRWGEFLQSFPRSTLDQLWNQHLQGVEFLTSREGIPVRECRGSYEERMRRAMSEQLAYIRSLPFWPVRGLYWFFVKRFLMQNKPIWEQNLRQLYPDVPPMAQPEPPPIPGLQ